MGTKLLDEIRRNMELKSTEELMAIWQENDRTQYSTETFRLVRSILLERGRQYYQLKNKTKWILKRRKIQKRMKDCTILKKKGFVENVERNYFRVTNSALDAGIKERQQEKNLQLFRDIRGMKDMLHF